MRQLLRAGQPPDKPLPLQPDKGLLALSIHPVVLWLLALGSLAFVATGIFILIVDPGRWLIALAFDRLFRTLCYLRCALACPAAQRSGRAVIVRSAGISHRMLAAEPGGRTPKQFAVFVHAETEKWVTPAKKAGIKVE
ncbi:MAG: hypothetical protein WBG10_06625 [Pseudolabrys sp.]